MEDFDVLEPDLKRVVVAVGSTGNGKSTIINMLFNNSFLGKAESFILSKGILPIIALNSLFLFTFGTIDFQKTPNYQRTDNSKLLCIHS